MIPIERYASDARAERFVFVTLLPIFLLGFLADVMIASAQSEDGASELERIKIRRGEETAMAYDQCLYSFAEKSLPSVETDMRLDCYYATDHAFPHAADMIREKLRLLSEEIQVDLQKIGRQIGENDLHGVKP